MIDVIQAIFLGLIQGFTEFFPVSSSGHLVLFQDILGINGNSSTMMSFDIMLHVGTLIALLIVFWKEFLGLFKPPFNRLLMLVVATIPAALIGALFQDPITSFFGTGKWLPYFFLITAALLFTTESYSRRRPLGTSVGWKQVGIMGIAQAIAVIPGLSRSGCTISAGILSGAEREKAAKFSFFMSIPVIAGAALVTVAHGGTSGMSDIGFTTLAAGMIAAAVSGFFALKLMLKVVKRNNYKWFVFYLVALSIFTFLNYYIIHLF